MPREPAMTERARAQGLPAWGSVLVVVAHPDDESFGLGGVLAAFADAGAAVAVLCYTHGEASTLHGVEGNLSVVRVGELADAARVLGAAPVRLLDLPDGALSEIGLDELIAPVLDMAAQVRAEGLLAFDSAGVTGHPDHVRATAAAVAAAKRLGLDVLGWTLPVAVATALAEEYMAGFTGHDRGEIDVVIEVDRTRQLEAVACHPSQAIPGSVLWRRLELLGDYEHLRFLQQPRPHLEQKNDAQAP